MRKIHQYVVVTCLLAFMVILCSCSESKKQEEGSLEKEGEVLQMEVDFEEPLRVFYEDAGFLVNFSNVYPDVELELCKISRSWEGEEMSIESWAEKYGDPDIVLLHPSSGFNLVEEYEKGQVEDIRAYCAEDAALDQANYVGGTFDVFANGEVLMGLPLSWQKQCLIVKESEMMNSALEVLPEGYTGLELFKAMLTEIQKEQYIEKFCWLHMLSFYYNLKEVAPKIDGKFEIDEEMFKALFEFSIQNEMNFEAADEAFGGVYEHLFQTQGEPALDPDACRGGYYGTSLMGAPQVTAIYAKSVAGMDCEDVEFFWIPTADNGDEYVGLVRDYAFIGKNSARKQQAYEVIRMMMDMPVMFMTQPTGFDSEIYSSVNIQQSIESLNYFNNLEQKLHIWNRGGELFYILDQLKLDEEELEEIRGVIKGISSLNMDLSEEETTELNKLYYDYKSLCVDSGSIDHAMCYAEMQKYFTAGTDIQ